MATLNENTTGLNEILALVNALPEGLDTSDATALANTILAGYTAYVNGEKITGTIPSQEAQEITPGTTDQTIASGKYLSGTQTIKGDANLIAENIAKGVSIFDVVGALEAGSGDSGDGAKIATGEFTPAEALGYYTITHDLGSIPKLAFIVAKNDISLTEINNLEYSYYYGGSSTRKAKYNATSINVMTYALNIEATYAALYQNGCWNSATTSTVICGSTAASNAFRANETYVWFVVG